MKKSFIILCLALMFVLQLSSCSEKPSPPNDIDFEETTQPAEQSTSAGSRSPSDDDSSAVTTRPPEQGTSPGIDLQWQGVYETVTDYYTSQLRIYNVTETGFDFGLFTLQNTGKGWWDQNGFSAHAQTVDFTHAQYTSDNKPFSVRMWADKAVGDIYLTETGIVISYEHMSDGDAPYSVAMPEKLPRAENAETAMYTMPFCHREQGQFFVALKDSGVDSIVPLFGEPLSTETIKTNGDEMITYTYETAKIWVYEPFDGVERVEALEVNKVGVDILRGLCVGDTLELALSRLPKYVAGTPHDDNDYIYYNSATDWCYIEKNTAGVSETLVIADGLWHYRLSVDENERITSFYVGNMY